MYCRCINLSASLPLLCFTVHAALQRMNVFLIICSRACNLNIRRHTFVMLREPTESDRERSVTCRVLFFLAPLQSERSRAFSLIQPIWVMQDQRSISSAGPSVNGIPVNFTELVNFGEATRCDLSDSALCSVLTLYSGRYSTLLVFRFTVYDCFVEYGVAAHFDNDKIPTPMNGPRVGL